MVYVFQHKTKGLNLCHVNPDMSCKVDLFSVSFAALVALETLLPSVSCHVALKVTGRNASVVALVTLVWLFSCVVPQRVFFQMARCNAGELAQCASVGFLTRVGSFVLLQRA